MALAPSDFCIVGGQSVRLAFFFGDRCAIMELYIILAVVAIGVLVGGIVGAGLGKWPARTRLGNMLKGALIGMGTFLVFFAFAVMVIRLFLGDMDGSEITHRS